MIDLAGRLGAEFARKADSVSLGLALSQKVNCTQNTRF